jgi:hypothetical protein
MITDFIIRVKPIDLVRAIKFPTTYLTITFIRFILTVTAIEAMVIYTTFGASAIIKASVFIVVLTIGSVRSAVVLVVMKMRWAIGVIINVRAIIIKVIRNVRVIAKASDTVM